jgi:hypothetical protein
VDNQTGDYVNTSATRRVETALARLAEADRPEAWIAVRDPGPCSP